MTLLDLPISLQLNIMQRLSDGRDLVSLGQVCPDLGLLTEDRLLWKNLCHYHFTDRQVEYYFNAKYQFNYIVSHTYGYVCPSQKRID